jgi:hypothetical protein
MARRLARSFLGPSLVSFKPEGLPPNRGAGMRRDARQVPKAHESWPPPAPPERTMLYSFLALKDTCPLRVNNPSACNPFGA